MFGHQDDTTIQQQDTNKAIDAVLADSQPASVIAPMSNDQVWQHPGTPLESVAPQPAAELADTLPTPSDTPTTNIANDLIDIKQQALSQLSPLVDHLDQSPEEKFRTTMMMIQASDDQSLIKTAYAAAQAISDEKTRAQALLDIVNEINYFTHVAPEN